MSEGSAAKAGSSPAAPLRQMTHNTDTTKLGYQLYKDSGASPVVWGNTTDTGKGFTAAAGDNTETVYGKIPKLQPASYGTFFDFVQVTLTY